MFSGFFGKGDKDAKPPTKGAGKSRGLEVIEDDPDTTWGLWNSAVAEQDSRFPAAGANSVLPAAVGADASALTLDLDISNAPTQPMELADMPPAQRKELALAVVEAHHQRVANTIRTLWGYKECSVYINKLIMNGADGMGHARVGFNQDAVQAMLELVDIHDALYGAQIDPGLDFADTRSTGWGKLR